MLFEDVIEAIKPFGPFQKRQFMLTTMVGMAHGLHTMVTVFTMATPDFRCAIPGLDNDTYSSQGEWHDKLLRQAIPFNQKDKIWSRCTHFEYSNFSYPDFSTNTTSSCNRWVYSKEHFEITVISELNLVCQHKELVTLAKSVLMGGLLGGSLILGALADFIGRKNTMMLSLAGQFAVALATGFISNYAAFVALRFLTTFFGMGAFLASFVAGIELVGPHARTLAGVMIEIFWAVSLFIILLLAYLLRNWHHLQIAVACCNLIYLPHFFLIPESPRWLATRGRTAEASAIIRQAAKVNKADVPENVLSLQDLQLEGPGQKVWQLFTRPRLLVRSLIIFLNWIVVSMVYYGLGLNVGSLSGDLYLNFLYSSIAELLSYFFCMYFLYRVGRRALHCFAVLLAGVACVLIIFPVLYGTESEEWISQALYMIGRFGSSASFATVYILSGELFPTVVRNSGMGASSFCGRIGGIASPYIAALSSYVSGGFATALPALVFGGMSVLAGISALFLPETRNKKLPESIEEAEKFGVTRWEMPPAQKKSEELMVSHGENLTQGTEAQDTKI